MSVIRLNNVSKSYEGAPVLREVFFRLSEGERVGLIDKVATRLLVFEGNGIVREVNGNWTMWQASQ